MKIKLLFLFTGFLIFFKPNVCFTQVVDLGSATSFSVFTLVGSFSNDSTTHVVGDIGTNVGTLTGFPPGTLTGTINVANSFSALAATGVTNAFNALNAMTCGMVIGKTLGNGQVLTPNIYCIHAATTLKGNLTLDGQGNPNAVFIFKIDSAFSVDTSAKIILTNSASLCNVYWQINGAFSLGARAAFQGTVLGAGAITLNLNSTLNGRALTTSGAISLHKTNVTIPTPPVATISANGSTSICQGDSVTLTASTANSFLWSTGATTKSITVRNAGSYSVTVTNACGKATSTATLINVNPVPITTISANGLLTFCQGDSVKLTASGGTKFLWSTGDTLATITVKASGSYTVIGTNATGCKDTSTATVIAVNPNPTAIITANGPLTFCQGDSVKLTASGGTKFLWSRGDTTSMITIKAGGSYTVVATNTNGCKGTSVASVVTVNPNPTAIITANGPLMFCKGDSVKLTASGGSKFLWSTGDTLATITVRANGSYTVVATNANGCKGTSVATIITTSPTISASGPLTFCQGDSVKLTATGTKFLWSTGDTVSSITVKTSGSYTVIGRCNDTSKATVITVNPKPTAIITANGPLAFCPGDSVKLTASGGTKFLWSTGDTTTTVTVKTSGSYTVVATNINGCKGTSAAAIITTSPTISASGPLTFCQGDSVKLTASGTKFLWSTGDTVSSITVKTNGSYTVIGRCNDTSRATIISVNPKPTAIITANGPLAFCPGDSVKLTASGGTKFLWSTGDTTTTITVKTSGSYTVVASNANGCKGTSAATIITTRPTISASGPLTFCQGDSVKLNATGTKFLWSTGDTVSSITVKTSGSYTVIGRCNDTSKATVITVNPNPNAIITANGPITFCQGDSVKLTASGGTKFLWSRGDSISVITVKASGSYIVVATTINGCKGTSVASVVTVNPNPIAIITANGPLTFCQGDSVKLTASGGNKFLWSNMDTTSNITVRASGTYTVVATNATGCKATSVATAVIVNPAIVPTITASGSLKLCKGDSVILTSSVASKFTWSTGDTTLHIVVKSSGSFTVTATSGVCTKVSATTVVIVDSIIVPSITASRSLKLCIGDSVILTSSQGSRYVWSTGDTTRNIVVKNAGTYSVLISSACGDTSLPVVVTVNNNRIPTITASGPTTFCEGGKVFLTASEGSYYRWTFGGKTQTVQVSTSGFYAVRVYNECGYNFSAPIRVTVNPIPNCTIVATSSLCNIASSQLCATSANAKYLWSTGDTTRCINITSIGTYSVTVSNPQGCSSFCSKTITDYQFPDCTISGDTTICPEKTTVLSAPAGNNTYKWNTGATSQSITITAAGTYTVSVTNSNGCASTCSKIVKSTVVPACVIMGKVNLCTMEKTELKGPMGATTYTWSNGSTEGWISVRDSGVYTLTVTYATGCPQTCSVRVTIMNCMLGADYTTSKPSFNDIIQEKSSIINMPKADEIHQIGLSGVGEFDDRALPNPFVHSTLIEFSSPISGNKIKVDVYNLQGQKVASLFEGIVSKNERKQLRFDAAGLTEGIYFYRITDGKISTSKKLVLMKN